MPLRLRVRRRERTDGHVVAFEGEIDGSTACHALDVLRRMPPDGRDLVLDLTSLSGVEPFGLEVLARGLCRVARERRLRLVAAPALSSALRWPAGSVHSEAA